MAEENNATKRSWWKLSIGILILILLSIFGLWWGVPTFLKWRADAQVKELCAKDGGVKVYETVTLPPEKFNQWGQINFYKPIDKENSLGPEYRYYWDVVYLERGDPDLIRQHSQVFRRSDNKLLGESIGYTRRGGDPIGPWMGSHFRCPTIQQSSEVALFGKIFVKGEK